MDDESRSTSKLHRDALAWLGKQGFPLEFRVAGALANEGFHVWPSYYVQSREDTAPREIDVLAVFSSVSAIHRIDFELYVECKWVRNKPWVIFCSSHAQVSDNLAIGSVIADSVGEAVLWLLHDSDLAKLPPFAAPKLPGYGGRELFSEANVDKFYAAMQSVVGAAKSGVDRGSRLPSPSEAQRMTLGFPVVVVDGPLMEVTLRPPDALEIRDVQSARIHWRGMEAHRLASVDIVTVDALPEFARTWKESLAEVSNQFSVAQFEVLDGMRKNSADPFRYRVGHRAQGRLKEAPALLRSLMGQRYPSQ